MATSNINKLNITATHILFISDIHFGRHVNAEEWQDSMRGYFNNFFLPYVRQIKAGLQEGEKLICINLGDTYQDRKAIDINVNNLSIDVCEDIAKEVEFYVINGNHDLAKKTNEGNTSLRSIEYVPNVNVLTDPTLITIKANNKNVKFIAIPFLGDCVKENEYLTEYSSKAKYALMHTELTKMRLDNGRPITNGANPEVFKGKIFSGHIHRRQESNNAIYVGSPYHLDKGDVGDVKGLYLLKVETGELTFKENNYSPIYHKIDMDKFIQLNEDERLKFLNNNYNIIVIQEEDVPKYKKTYDFNNLGAGSTAKETKYSLVKKTQTMTAEIDNDYKEKTICELLYDSIGQLDIEDDAKKRLCQLSDSYYNEAEQKLG